MSYIKNKCASCGKEYEMPTGGWAGFGMAVPVCWIRETCSIECYHKYQKQLKNKEGE